MFVGEEEHCRILISAIKHTGMRKHREWHFNLKNWRMSSKDDLIDIVFYVDQTFTLFVASYRGHCWRNKGN